MAEQLKAKKQHFVPELYLQAFASGGRLHVFDKTTGKTFPSSVRDSASRRFFYDIPELDDAAGVSQALEKFFQPFEDAAATVLGALRLSLASSRFVAIARAQRIDLSLFLALQMLRTPEAREESVQLSLALHKEAFLAWDRERYDGFRLDPASFALEISRDQQLRTQARNILDEDLRDRIAAILFRHCWLVLENPFPAPFITSDHPACNHGTVSHPLWSMQGLASFGAEILLPLSPRHLLLILERRAFPQSTRLDGRLSVLRSEANLMYYNHWQVRHSTRFLYSVDSEFSLARSMIGECPELADPQNRRIDVHAPVVACPRPARAGSDAT